MDLEGDNGRYELYYGFFEGHKVLFRKNLDTGATALELTDEVARRIFGYRDLEDMLSSDLILDTLNEFKEKLGEFPIQKG